MRKRRSLYNEKRVRFPLSGGEVIEEDSNAAKRERGELPALRERAVSEQLRIERMGAVGAKVFRSEVGYVGHESCILYYFTHTHSGERHTRSYNRVVYERELESEEYDSPQAAREAGEALGMYITSDRDVFLNQA